MEYRRTAERVSTSLFGLMDFGESLSTCLVTDLSSKGARLRVSSAKALPARFTLRISRTGACHYAGLRWRNGDEVGVEFYPAG